MVGGARRGAAGRGGQGPGEFTRNITHLGRMGADSLLVSDAGDRTIRKRTMGRSSVFAVGATTVVAGETDRFELYRYDAAGGPTTIIRVTLPVALLEDDGRRRTLALDSLAVVSDTLPAYATVRIDDAGRIWVQEFVPVYEERAANWWVLNGDGAFIARVAVPRGFDLRAFSADQVWGTRLDAFDVPYVERHRIIR